jgi:putative colanic acid biosynthesis acetyltransferase WcaF
VTAVRLKDYDNSWFHPGRHLIWQVGWFFLGLPLLRLSLLPSSSFRVKLLRFFGARVGEGVAIKPGVRVKFPWKLTIGNHCWLGEDCWIDNLASVALGNDVCISQGAYLCTGNHDWTDPSFGLMVRSIRLENGAWVGARAVIAPGVVLGECAIAAAGSVVVRNIPSFEIHAGSPASFVKVRRIGPDKNNSTQQVHERVAS